MIQTRNETLHHEISLNVMVVLMFLYFLTVNSMLLTMAKTFFLIRDLVAKLHVSEYGGTIYCTFEYGGMTYCTFEYGGTTHCTFEYGGMTYCTFEYGGTTHCTSEYGGTTYCTSEKTCF